MLSNLDPVVGSAVLITLKAMLSLFVFMGIFYAIVEGLMRLFPGKPSRGDR